MAQSFRSETGFETAHPFRESRRVWQNVIETSISDAGYGVADMFVQCFNSMQKYQIYCERLQVIDRSSFMSRIPLVSALESKAISSPQSGSIREFSIATSCFAMPNPVIDTLSSQHSYISHSIGSPPQNLFGARACLGRRGFRPFNGCQGG